MPLIIEWKICKEKEGYWRPRLIMKWQYLGEELSLRPHMEFRRHYSLPGTIYCGSDTELEKDGSSDYCYETYTIDITINTYISKPLMINNILIIHDQHKCNGKCDNCRIFLPWRPNQDYSDFEEVFYEMAYDMCEAWNKAVAEAMKSEVFEEKSVIISSSDFYDKKSEPIPTRKIIV